MIHRLTVVLWFAAACSSGAAGRDGGGGGGGGDLAAAGDLAGGGDAGAVGDGGGACTYTCSAACQPVCDAFTAGRATLQVVPGVGVAHLGTAKVAGDFGTRWDSVAGHYHLLVGGSLGADADWQALGVRLVHPPPGTVAVTFDLGLFARAPTATNGVDFDLAPHTVCDFEQVALYDAASGAILAQDYFHNQFEGGTWLCTTGTFIDPYAMCGAGRPSDFQLNCP
jgi:hypothetical protein